MDCERLIQLREEKGMTKTAVASYIGISSAGYGYYESGQRTPPPDMLIKLSELFNVSVDYLLGKTDFKSITKIDENSNAVTVEYMTTKERIPILGTIKAGYNMYAEQNVLGYKDTDASKIKNKEVFWLKVKGNSMNAVGIFDGSLVLVEKKSAVDNKKIAVVRINGDEATVKQVIISDNSVVLQPRSTDTSLIPLVVTKEEFESGYAEIIGEIIEVSFNPNELFK